MTRNNLLSELERLVSEDRNAETMKIDTLPVTDILQLINNQDMLVAAAVQTQLSQIAKAVEKIVAAFEDGARLIYIGAGTSGRLGVLDASECPPTFGVSDDMVVGLIAGGDHALRHPIEGAEDNSELGAEDLKAINLTSKDVVVGIAVSGRTPYVIGALEYAKSLGCSTVSLSCNRDSMTGQVADIDIAPVVGPEVLTGSTRMKSGTAQKMVLNMLTTASMIRIGKTYQNLMVDVETTNDKLIARSTRIVIQATGCDADVARSLLKKTGNDVKLAIMMAKTGLPIENARGLLDDAKGFLREALNAAGYE